MPKVIFTPSQKSAEVEPKTKLLLAGRKAGVEIRFACASCRCGTCAVLVRSATSGVSPMSPMKAEETKLLTRLKLSTDGSIRLACQARVESDCSIDLDFQETYDTPKGFEDDEA